MFQTVSLSTKFRPSTVSGKKGSIYYQFIRKRKVKVVTTPYKVFPEEWNEELSSVRIGSFSHQRERQLQEIYLSLKQEEEKINRKIFQLEQRGNYSLVEIADFYHNQTINVSEFVEELVLELERSKQYRLIEAYRVAAKNLMTFCKGQEVPLNTITAQFMKDYEKYMEEKRNTPNTISFYNRNTRAIYNKAIKKGLIDRQMQDPFSDVFTGVAKTRKRAINQGIMDNLMKLDLTIMETEVSEHKDLNIKMLKKSSAFARDMFILSFYLRGISFIDLAHLKKSDLKNNCITYTRSKTGQYFEIAVNSKIKEIILKYASFCKDSDLLLPILLEGNSRKYYKNALKRQNDHLKIISNLVGLNKKLTTYVSRHSWASIALTKGYSISIISQGLGHESEKTTKIYLDSFDYSKLHEANEIITNLSKKTGRRK